MWLQMGHVRFHSNVLTCTCNHCSVLVCYRRTCTLAWGQGHRHYWKCSTELDQRPKPLRRRPYRETRHCTTHTSYPHLLKGLRTRVGWHWSTKRWLSSLDIKVFSKINVSQEQRKNRNLKVKPAIHRATLLLVTVAGNNVARDKSSVYSRAAIAGNMKLLIIHKATLLLATVASNKVASCIASVTTC